MKRLITKLIIATISTVLLLVVFGLAAGAFYKHGGGASKTDVLLIRAASNGDIEGVKQLLAAGADVNAKYKDGFTPLHRAAREGQKELAELLIAKGADVNARDDIGRTPLYYAAVQGQKEIAELLIAKGANVNAVGKHDSETPLDSAETLFGFDSPEVKAAKRQIADLLRKHGGKTGEELKAEGK